MVRELSPSWSPAIQDLKTTGKQATPTMFTMKTSSSLPALVLGSCTVLSAFGQTQVTSLNEPMANLFQIGASGPTATYLGMPFKTDGLSYTLGPVTARVFDTGQSPGSLQAFLYAADASFLPTGAALTSFVFGSIPANSGPDTEFTPASSVILDPNSRYLFALQPTSGNFVWIESAEAAGFDTPGGHGWDLPAGLVLSGDAGASWSFLGSGTYAYRNQGAVAATPVPEPSEWAALGGTALLGFAAVRHWRRIA